MTVTFSELRRQTTRCSFSGDCVVEADVVWVCGYDGVEDGNECEKQTLWPARLLEAYGSI